MPLFASLDEITRFAPEKMTKCNVFDSSNMFCDVYCFEPGQIQKPHRHDGCDKIYFVLDGCVELQIGDETRRLQAGEFAHAPPSIDHGAFNPGPARLRLLVFMAPKP